MRARITIEYLDSVPDAEGRPVELAPVVLNLSELHVQQQRKVYSENDWGFSGGEPLLVPDPVTSVVLSGKTVPDPEKLAEFERRRPFLREVGA